MATGPVAIQHQLTVGDYAIRLRLKMVCKPGAQFVIRRKACAMMKNVVDANSITFAQPTVTVPDGETAAAAKQGLEIAGSASAQPSRPLNEAVFVLR